MADDYTLESLDLDLSAKHLFGGEEEKLSPVGFKKKDVEGTPDIVIKDRIYVKKDARLLSKKEVKERYIKSIFDDKTCSKCEEREFRAPDHEACQSCPAYSGTFNFYQVHKPFRGEEYLSFPVSDIIFIRGKAADREDIEAIRLFKLRTFSSKLKFTGTLFKKGDVDSDGNPRADQEAAAAQWLREKNGVIELPPRAGKTALAVNLTCALRVKTLVLAHQSEFLSQFYKTYMGGKGRVALTNAREIRRDTGKQVVKLVTKMSDFLDKDCDVFLCTPQLLYKKTKQKVEQYINGRISLVIVDECHQSMAPAYRNVLYHIVAPYRMGLSATWRRKDGLSDMMPLLLGPVTSRGEVSTLKPEIRVRKFKTEPPSSKFRLWYMASKWAAASQERRTELVDAIFDDLENGHHAILVPVDNLKHIDLIVKDINARARKLNKKGKDYPLELAFPFHASVNRSRALKKIDSGRPAVMVAIRSMVKQGIDMKEPSSLHMVIPMSATAAAGAPMFRQLSYRVATPRKGKKPMVTIWVDEIDMFKSALAGLLYQEIYPGLKSGAYFMTPGERSRFASYLAKKSTESKAAAGDRVSGLSAGSWV